MHMNSKLRNALYVVVVAAVLMTSALGAVAAENYTVPVNDARQIQVSIMVDYNRIQICDRLSLVGAACTQANACTTVVPAAAGGASCSAAQARAAKVRLYPQTQPGREEWFTFEYVVGGLQDLKDHAEVAIKALRARYIAAQNTATKDADCTAIGTVASCQ
jgi:hypothetical protein